uniref:Glycosyl transferase family 1 domain-containing protein n=1 Tax=Romanomermis culicivorax TaxID=13658 RepID=A0A915IGR1_ROMCU
MDRQKIRTAIGCVSYDRFLLYIFVIYWRHHRFTQYKLDTPVVELLQLPLCEPKGRASRDGLPDYYATTHVTVIPSLYELFGLVAIELMRTGMLVITSAVRDSPYIFDQGRNGLLVPANDTEALSWAIIAMLNNEGWPSSQSRRKNMYLLKCSLILVLNADVIDSDFEKHKRNKETMNITVSLTICEKIDQFGKKSYPTEEEKAQWMS